MSFTDYLEPARVEIERQASALKAEKKVHHKIFKDSLSELRRIKSLNSGEAGADQREPLLSAQTEAVQEIGRIEDSLKALRVGGYINRLAERLQEEARQPK